VCVISDRALRFEDVIGISDTTIEDMRDVVRYVHIYGCEDFPYASRAHSIYKYGIKIFIK
jgi:hypothetical protein